MTVTGAQAVWFITVGRVNLRYALSCGVSICFFFPPLPSVVSTSVHYLEELAASSYEAALGQQMDNTMRHYIHISFFFYSLVLAHGEVIKQDEGFIISARDADQFWPHVSWGRIV